MKVFKVTVPETSWDTYDGVVVVAESAEKVQEMFHHGEGYAHSKLRGLYIDGNAT